MLKRSFGNWSPGAIWTPPKQFLAVNLPRELRVVLENSIKQNQPQIEEKLSLQISNFYANTHSSRSDVPKSAAIATILTRDTSPVITQRRKRLELDFSEPDLAIYNRLLKCVYSLHPDPQKIYEAYSQLPYPQPKHIDPQILDDMLQILLSLRHSKDTQGQAYRSIVDDMLDSGVPVTSRELSLYLLFLSTCDMSNIQQINIARAKVSEKLISWHQTFANGDLPTLNTLFQVGLRLDMSIVQDLVHQQDHKNYETYRQMVKSGKMSPQTVLQMSTLNSALLASVLSSQLKSDNSDSAEDFLAHILAEFKNTFQEPLSARDQVIVQGYYRSFDFMSQIAPVHVPLVPSQGLFMLFLSHFTRTENFPKVQRTLVQMAQHGCYPQTYAIYKILAQFSSLGNKWTVEELDRLVHYLCDVSLYHGIMTVPLAKAIARVYRKFDVKAAKELQEFLLGLVGASTKEVPVKQVKIVERVEAVQC